MTLCLSLFIANRINKLSHKGKGVYQSLFFIPSVTSISVISPGLVLPVQSTNRSYKCISAKLGVSSDAMPQWLNSCDLALPTLAIIGVWQNIGFTTLLFVAGLQNIPKIYYEAAEIDVPKEIGFLQDNDSPPFSSLVLCSLHADNQFFQDVRHSSDNDKRETSGKHERHSLLRLSKIIPVRDAGIGAAASWVIFIILLGIYMLQQKLGEKNVHY